MTSLAELTARVGACTGEDRDVQIDADVFELIGAPGMRQGMTRHSDGSWRQAGGDISTMVWPPPYTKSLDSVVALVEAQMPNWSWSLGELRGVTIRTGTPRWRAHLHDHGTPDKVARDYREGEQRTPALALLLAFLRAKQSQSTEGG